MELPERSFERKALLAPEENRTEFTNKIIRVIQSIPKGYVLTYGGVAAVAGNPLGARAVVWVLHSSSEREGLPWHRVINGKGTISLKPGYGYELQRQLLESEGIEFDIKNRVDLKRFQWKP